MHTPPLPAEIDRCLFPCREFEGEAALDQTPGHDSTALENELGLGSERERPDLEHPARRGETNPCAPRLPKEAHEFGIRQRLWRREIHNAVDAFMIDQPHHRTHKVAMMNPRN